MSELNNYAGIERLRRLVQEAYDEGFEDGMQSATNHNWGGYGDTNNQAWDGSCAKQALAGGKE